MIIEPFNTVLNILLIILMLFINLIALAYALTIIEDYQIRKLERKNKK